MPPDGNLRQISAQIETSLADLASIADAATRERAETLVRALVEFYGAGLERIVEIVGASEVAGAALLDRLAADDLVASLLILHDLHPVPVETRIERALAKMRPALGSHAGGVAFLGISEDGVVHLRLDGGMGHGCPASTGTVKGAIERAIAAAAPEVAGIEVEERVRVAPAGQIIPLASLRRNGKAAHGQTTAASQVGGHRGRP